MSNSDVNNPRTKMTEVTNTSDDNSTGGEVNNESELIEDSYTYLQGLDSGNLMQFSQQTVINELIHHECTDIKPSLDVLPTFEEHDMGGYQFKLNLRQQRKGKVKWEYSKELNKVYIRMNDVLNIEAVYLPKTPRQQLLLRVIFCFTKEVSVPVQRCQNHISKDAEINSRKRNSLLRCDNPNAEYCGAPEGTGIHERLSVLVPLIQHGAIAYDNNAIKQSIALKFTCQNSCIGRKETSLIFLLESSNGEILSQRVIDVRICSCVKRDRNIDERNMSSKKRKLIDDDLTENNKKMCKDSKNSAAVKSIKREYHASDDTETDSDSEDQYRVYAKGNGKYQLSLGSCTKSETLKAIMAVMSSVSLQIVNDPKMANRYLKKFKSLKNLYDLTSKR